MAGGMPVGADPWRVTLEERAKHDDQFVQLNPTGGYITGEQAKNFFLQSQLPPMVLGQIWALADMNADGKMDKNEFSIAMKLIQMKLKGFEVPKSLPPSLKIVPTPSVPIGGVPLIGMIPSPMVPPPIGAGFPPTGVPPVGMPVAFPPPPSSVSNIISMTGFGRSASPVEMKTHRSASVTSQDSPTGSINASLQEWAVPHVAKLKYTQTFNTNDRARSGFLTGSQARNILVQTGLAQNILAQIWAMADIDNDGKLTCEEFCLAMHLVDSVRAGDKLPTALPPELIPPSYRRARASSIQGVPSAVATAVPGSTPGGLQDLLGGISESKEEAERQRHAIATFEDKRKENFEKGHAELEKRRQALVESQRRDQEERERKDREEQERRDRIRQEQERRRQMELEKQLAKQRELKQEKEEQRRKQLEQREAARREMERQRQLEWEKQRRQELMTQRQKEQERVLQLKAQKMTLVIELEQLNEKTKEVNNKLADNRKGVNELKEEIDRMRSTRDTKVNEIESLKNRMKNQKQKLFILNQEKEKLETQIKSGSTSNPTAESFNIVSHSFNNKQITLNQLKERLSTIEKEVSAKLNDVENNNTELKNIKQQLSELLKESEKTFQVYNEKRQKVIEMRKAKGLSTPPSKAVDNGWGDSGDWSESRRESTTAWPVDKDEWGTTTTQATWGSDNTSAAWGSQDNDWGTAEQRDVSADWGSDQAWPTSSETAAAQPDAWISPTEPGKAIDQQDVTGKMIKYRVLYAFEARNADELSIEPGDVIMVPEGLAHEPGWLGGELRGKTGWFPEAYVELMEGGNDEVTAKDNGETSPTNASGVQETVHIVGTEMKMTLTGIQEAPETIDNGHEAQPSAFIQVPKSVSAENASPVPGQGTSVEGLQAQALFPWRAKKENHLTFNKGDVITVREQQDMWWYGELDGKCGWFPKSYVRLIAGPKKEGFQQDDDVDTAETTAEAVSTPVTEYFEAMYGYQSNESGDLSFNPGDVIMVTKKDGDWWTGIIGDRVGVFPCNYVKQTGVQTPDKEKRMSFDDQKENDVCADNFADNIAQDEQIDERTGELLSEMKERQEQQQQYDDASLQIQREAPEPPRSPKMKGGKKPDIAMVIAPYAATGPEQLNLQRGQLIQIRKKSQNGWWEGELQAKGKKRQIGWFPASYVKQLTSSARNTPEPGGDEVLAIYPYEAQNEDELSFTKGSTITVINKDDGSAWWKGECNGNVGLFPANYVQPIDGSQSEYAGLSSVAKKRQDSIRELINTEQSYMDDMSIVMDAFYRPLKEAKVCTDQELKVIFVNWKELIACNLKILKAFRVRKTMNQNGVIPVIGDILCETIPHLTPYIRFCSCQLNAAALIQNKTESNPEFKSVTRKCCQDPRTKGMPVSSYLLKPMQRITKYPLLIKKILEYTPDDHPDKEQLDVALSRAEELCNQVNEGVREKENSDRLEFIQQHVQCDGLMEKITFNSLTNTLGPRKFIFSGALYKAKSNKELATFLFNDFLLLTQPSKSLGNVSLVNFDKASNVQFKMYKQPIFLNEIMVKLPQDSEDNLHFYIHHIDRTYNLKTLTSTERNIWVKKIEDASRYYRETESKRREKAHSMRAQRTAGVGRLLVVVVEGLDLKVKSNGQSDLYCEVSMGCQEHRTKVISETSNPKWNASMQFIVKDVEQDVLCITVFDRDYFAPNDFLGRTEVKVAEIWNRSRDTKEPITKKLVLYEGEGGLVTVKFDLQLFDVS